MKIRPNNTYLTNYYVGIYKELRKKDWHKCYISVQYVKLKNMFSKYQLGTYASQSHVIHDAQGRIVQIFELFSLFMF